MTTCVYYSRNPKLGCDEWVAKKKKIGSQKGGHLKSTLKFESLRVP